MKHTHFTRFWPDLFPVLFVALLLAFAMPAVAQTGGTGKKVITAIQLHQICTSPYDIDSGMCAGYVTAVAERLLRDPSPAGALCLSAAISADVLVANMRRFWEENRPYAHETALDNVETALRHRFRCP